MAFNTLFQDITVYFIEMRIPQIDLNSTSKLIVYRFGQKKKDASQGEDLLSISAIKIRILDEALLLALMETFFWRESLIQNDHILFKSLRLVCIDRWLIEVYILPILRTCWTQYKTFHGESQLLFYYFFFPSITADFMTKAFSFKNCTRDRINTSHIRTQRDTVFCSSLFRWAQPDVSILRCFVPPMTPLTCYIDYGHDQKYIFPYVQALYTHSMNQLSAHQKQNRASHSCDVWIHLADHRKYCTQKEHEIRSSPYHNSSNNPGTFHTSTSQ